MFRLIVSTLTLVSVALGLTILTSAQAQQLAAAAITAVPQQEPQDVCTAPIKEILRDGGAAFKILKAESNVEGRKAGEKLKLFYKYTYGYFGPDPFDVEAIFHRWEHWANTDQAWFVIANRSILPKVQKGEWNQTIQMVDEAKMEVLDETIWTAYFVAADGQKCQVLSLANVFKENYDLPFEVWSMLNPKTPPKPHDKRLD